MSIKANKYKELHHSDSEDAESAGYESDEQQARFKTKTMTTKKGKGAVSKATKGRRTAFDAFAKEEHSDTGSSDEENEEESDEESEGFKKGQDDAVTGAPDQRFRLDMTEDEDENDRLNSTDEGKGEEHEDGHGDDNIVEDKMTGKKDKQKKVKPLTPEELAKFQEAYEKTGIVYISRIPPFMKPIKIRHLLSQFGEIGRIYLAPEDAKVAARRKKYGGNKKQNYTEGWVEFKDKKVAKTVAKTLNTTIIGGKKNSHYHDDIWNIKYLPKFKWNHLTERIAYENASRAQRLQAEINQAKRENKAILANIEKSKMIQSIEEKKAAKRKAATESEPAAGGADDKSNLASIRRAFKQRRLETKDKPKPVEGKMQSVLSSVFGR